jgi:hypothetical protein
MQTEFSDFTEETFPKISQLVSICFGDGILPQLKRILDNPVRKQIVPAGCIGFEDGKAVCFKASIVRRMYLGQEQMFGVFASTFCKDPDGCSLPVLFEVHERAEGDQYQSRLCLGNTCIYVAAKFYESFGWRPGAESWTEMRFGIIRPIRFLWLLIRRKVFHLPQPVSHGFKHAADEMRSYATEGEAHVRRVMNFDSRFDDFWKRYLSKNRGIVASRDVETLTWLFGEDVRSGKCVLLAAFCDKNELEGFIVLRPMRGSPDRWQIMDMIALENAPERMDLLLRGARRFLKKETSAITLESTGFPDFIQPVLNKHMPHLRKTGHNRFEWISNDPEVVRVIEQTGNTRDSWFFGPFDGDYNL